MSVNTETNLKLPVHQFEGFFAGELDPRVSITAETLNIGNATQVAAFVQMVRDFVGSLPNVVSVVVTKTDRVETIV